MQVVDFEPRRPNVLLAEGADGVYVYPTAFPEFELWLVAPVDCRPLLVPRGDCGRIALVASGEFTLEGDDGAFPLRSGEAVFIPADEQVFAQGNGQLFITASGA